MQAMRRIVVGSLALAAAGLLAACGGTGSPGSGTSNPGGPGGGTSNPGGPGSGTSNPGGPGGAFDACSLLTGSEAGGAVHTEALTSSGTPGDPASCTYRVSSGDEAIVLTSGRDGAAAYYQSFVDSSTGEPVAGVGDRAIYESGTRRLLLLAGDRFVMVSLRNAAGAADPVEIGKIIAARLTTGSVPSGLAVTPPPVAKAQTACDLLTPAEAANELNLEALKTDGAQSQFCNLSLASSGEVVISVYFQRTNGSSTWDSLVAGMTTEPVGNIGEKAVFEPDSRKLFVLKGDSIFFVQVHSTDYDESAALSADEQLAHIMVDKI
jgi:hypothetical protein